MAENFTKDPDEKLDYYFDWSSWLPTGDQIATSTWILSSGLTKESESNTLTTACVWISGGTAGRPYNVTNRITTTDGRISDRSMTIRILDR